MDCGARVGSAALPGERRVLSGLRKSSLGVNFCYKGRPLCRGFEKKGEKCPVVKHLSRKKVFDTLLKDYVSGFETYQKRTAM